jgi:hypothetical protein
LLVLALFALALAGCASGLAAQSGRRAAVAVRSPDRALLIAPSKPDCTFQEIGLGDTVPVAEDIARRKLEFERACYRRAEMQMRARLRRLQAAVVAGSMPPACALTSRTERSHCVGVVRTTFCDAWQK